MEKQVRQEETHYGLTAQLASLEAVMEVVLTYHYKEGSP